MCGIVGYWSRSDSDADLRADLPRALRSLNHRGPDDHGSWQSPSATLGLAHARLSILDLSSKGHQPMVSTRSSLAMTYNGEVYNFREIRRELESLGHHFRGSGDSEVILSAFEEWGEAAVDRFIGMFALALWSERERRLRLFRDRVGVKPLYYWAHENGDAIVFASELKAVLSFSRVARTIDPRALGEYFQYGYIAAPRTIFRDIYKLPAGHTLEIGAETGASVRPYWDLTRSSVDRTGRSEDELAEELEALLIDAFRYRTVSDVPVGIFLSGGLDSSLVTALLSKHTNQGVRTFTIGFEESFADESKWAKEIASYLGTEHTEHTLSASECAGILRAWPSLYDEPFGDSSGAPTYLVSRMARSEVKVALSADGGDELFGGYSSYSRLPAIVSGVRSVPRPLRLGLKSLLNERSLSTCSTLSGVIHSERNFKLVDRLRKLRNVLPDADPQMVFSAAHSHWNEEEVSQLLGDYSPPRAGLDAYSGCFEEQMMLWDFHHYLPDDILAKVDRATMAVSLEGREPMLDHRLVEFAFGLPLSMRKGRLGSKHLLRKVLYRYVPRDLVDRPKQGFAIPLRKWLLGELRELVGDYLSPDRIRGAGIFEASVVSANLQRFQRGDSVNATRIWYLLAFEMWRERWCC